MARRRLLARIAPLAADPALARGEHAADRLLEVLRQLAISKQTEEAQVFYSIREVAQHFGVPPSTVSRAFHRLEEEGLLVSLRGSKTLLQGLSTRKQVTLRGMIGLPVFTPRFITSQDYRTFLLRLARELDTRGFGVTTLFYDSANAQQQRQLQSWIANYDFDVVLWHQPDRFAREITKQLKDRGVRLADVTDRGQRSSKCRYQVRRESAITAILRAWRSEVGIESAIIVQRTNSSGDDEEMLKRLLSEVGLEHELRSFGNQRLAAFIDSLAAKKDCGVILPGVAAAVCAFRAPRALGRLMSASRVALTGGPISFPFAPVPDVVADVVVVDWQLVAEQIASDLFSGKATDRATTSVLRAEAHLRAPLRQHAQSL